MCTTEIWSYRDCSCTLKRKLPCSIGQGPTQSIERQNISSFHSLKSSCTAGCTSYSTTPSPRVSVSEPELSSVHRTALTCDTQHEGARRVHRQFLEPICEKCLLKEMGSEGWFTSHPDVVQQRVMANKQHVHRTSQDATSKIRGSGSKVTTADLSDAQDDNLEGSLENDLDIRPNHNVYGNGICSASPSESPILASSALENDTTSLQKINTSKTSLETQNSATTKPSINPSDIAKCQPKQPDSIKKLRRRGIDIGREDLRISSRWSDGEKQSMKNFRDALKEAAKDNNETAFSRFIKKENTRSNFAVKNMKTFFMGLRTSASCVSLSRESEQPNSRIEWAPAEHAVCPLPDDQRLRMTSRQQAFRDQHYAERQHSFVDSIPMSINVDITATTTPETASIVSDSGPLKGSTSDLSETPCSPPKDLSWDEHLTHDLSQRSDQRKRIEILKSQTPASTSLESSLNFTSNKRFYHQNPLVSLYPVSNEFHQHPDISDYARFPSSLYASSPTTVSTPTSVSATFPNECLGDIVPSDEFEPTGTCTTEWQYLEKEQSHFGILSSPASSNSTSMNDTTLSGEVTQQSIPPAKVLLHDTSVGDIKASPTTYTAKLEAHADTLVNGIALGTVIARSNECDGCKNNKGNNEDNDDDDSGDIRESISIQPLSTTLMHALSPSKARLGNL